jgi:hypothetical protein
LKAGKPKPKPKPVTKPAPAAVTKPSTKVEVKAKTESKPAAKSAGKLEFKPGAKPAAKAEAKPAAKVALKSSAKPVAKPEAKSAPRPAAKPNAQPAAKPAPKAGAKQAPKPAVESPIPKESAQTPKEMTAKVQDLLTQIEKDKKPPEKILGKTLEDMRKKNYAPERLEEFLGAVQNLLAARVAAGKDLAFLFQKSKKASVVDFFNSIGKKIIKQPLSAPATDLVQKIVGLIQAA